MASNEKDAAAIETAKTLANVPWCDDYEKMVSEMLFNPLAPELILARARAEQLRCKYNYYSREGASPESYMATRRNMLNDILGKAGEHVFIQPPFTFDYGCNIIIGHNFFANFHLVILDNALVKIGNNVAFGPSVSIYSATHETDIESRRKRKTFGRGVTIGDDCWIGGSTVILPGVTIGRGCTIGGGSVVTRDIPEFSVAMGSPARVVKKVDPVPED